LDQNLMYFYDEDEENRLSLVIAEIEGGRNLFLSAGTKTCILYDTTFGTNKFGCKLGLFTSE
jgi:hypothetical protein